MLLLCRHVYLHYACVELLYVYLYYFVYLYYLYVYSYLSGSGSAVGFGSSEQVIALISRRPGGIFAKVDTMTLDLYVY